MVILRFRAVLTLRTTQIIHLAVISWVKLLQDRSGQEVIYGRRLDSPSMMQRAHLFQETYVHVHVASLCINVLHDIRALM